MGVLFCKESIHFYEEIHINASENNVRWKASTTKINWIIILWGLFGIELQLYYVNGDVQFPE